jgi:L-fuconolactonase
MTLDAHQHFWHYDPVRDAWITDEMAVLRRDYLPEDLAPLLAAAGIDGSIAVQADPSEAETRFLLRLAEAHLFIRGVVGWIDLQADDLPARLDVFAGHPRLCGFRHLVQAEPDDFLLRPAFQRGLRHLAEHGYPYDLLLYPHQLPAALKLIEVLPNLRLVVDHLAKPYIRTGQVEPWATQMRVLAQAPQVYCKVSGLITEADWQRWTPDDLRPYLDVVFDAFGPARLMYGSDWPVCLLAGRYDQVWSLVANYLQGYSPAEQAGVWGENARRFYRLTA